MTTTSRLIIAHGTDLHGRALTPADEAAIRGAHLVALTGDCVADSQFADEQAQFTRELLGTIRKWAPDAALAVMLGNHDGWGAYNGLMDVIGEQDDPPLGYISGQAAVAVGPHAFNQFPANRLLKRATRLMARQESPIFLSHESPKSFPGNDSGSGGWIDEALLEAVANVDIGWSLPVLWLCGHIHGPPMLWRHPSGVLFSNPGGGTFNRIVLDLPTAQVERIRNFT